MRSFDVQEYLSHHIPYKIQAVLLGRRVLQFLLVYRDGLPTQVTLGSAALVRATTVRVFTNAAVEHGVMAARTLVEFLGIKRKPRTGEWDGNCGPRFASDVTILRFGGSLVTKADVEALDWWSRTRGLDLVDLLETADFGCAHLTHGADPKEVRTVLGGLDVALRLFHQYFWSQQAKPPLGEPYIWEEIGADRAGKDGVASLGVADWTGECPVGGQHRPISRSSAGPPANAGCEDCGAAVRWRLADYFDEWSVRVFEEA